MDSIKGVSSKITFDNQPHEQQGLPKWSLPERRASKTSAKKSIHSSSIKKASASEARNAKAPSIREIKEQARRGLEISVHSFIDALAHEGIEVTTKPSLGSIRAMSASGVDGHTILIHDDLLDAALQTSDRYSQAKAKIAIMYSANQIMTGKPEGVNPLRNLLNKVTEGGEHLEAAAEYLTNSELSLLLDTEHSYESSHLLNVLEERRGQAMSQKFNRQRP
jgi:hypothetical protein